MELVSPTLKYQASWEQMIKDLAAEHSTGFWNFPEPPVNLSAYIQLCQDFSEDKNVPPDWVANTTYWLIDQGECVGHVNIRHRLNDHLQKCGGHIGYAINPQHRAQGYGKNILKLAIVKVLALGISPILVTCNENNVGSRKIIEANGGVLAGSSVMHGTPVQRYWIQG